MDSTEKNCGGVGGGGGGGVQWIEMKPVVKDFVHARSAKGA